MVNSTATGLLATLSVSVQTPVNRTVTNVCGGDWVAVHIAVHEADAPLQVQVRETLVRASEGRSLHTWFAISRTRVSLVPPCRR